MIHYPIIRRTLTLLILAVIGLSMPALRPGRAAGDPFPAATTLAQVIAEDGVANDNFGAAVAIDGDLLAVGAPYVDRGASNAAGMVYLYRRDAAAPTGWAEIARLTGDPQDSDRFGEHVALRGDVVAVGAPHENVDGKIDRGAVYVFERDRGGANAWGLARKLSDDSLNPLGQFGSDVALDGGLLLVGAEGAWDPDGWTHDHKGTAYLFDRATGWGLVKQLYGEGTIRGRNNDEFGSSVAIDGDMIVVGARRADVSGIYQNDGAAFVFRRDQGGADNWGQHAMLVVAPPPPPPPEEPDDPHANDLFGSSVAIDGGTIVVGAPSEEAPQDARIYSVGAAYVFQRDPSADGWGLVKRLAAADGATRDSYGGALAVAGDEIWVGAHGVDGGGTDSGRVYRYERGAGGANAWGEAERLEPQYGLAGERFGTKVAVSGATLLVGAPGRDVSRGAVYITGEGGPPDGPATRIYLPHISTRILAPTGVLRGGGIVRATTGALIGAVEGAFPEPMEVTIAATQRPAQSLGSIVRPVGDFHVVGAPELVVAPLDKPLLVGLPVPAGANPDDLAVAVLTPAEMVLDGGGAGSVWTTALGSYDADSNLFVATVSALLPRGATMVLIEHPLLDPLPPAAAGAQAARPAQTPATATFSVTCDLVRWPGAACTARNKALLASELERAFADFVGTHQFREPRLGRRYGVFKGPDQKPVLALTGDYFGVEVATEPCGTPKGPIGGQYSYVTESVLVCMTPTSTSADIRAIARHELFHAIQAAYDKVHKDRISTPQQTSWTIEGTAAAAERSSASMLRSRDFPVRTITDTLTADRDLTEYSAQDFWVYTGLVLGESLAYLKPIFETGATPEHVDQEFPLSTAYWGWVTNQAFEKEYDLGGALVSGRCKPETAVIGTPLALDYDSTDHTQSTLPPLTSVMVQVTFNKFMEGATIRADNDGDSNDLRYVVYKAAEPACGDVPDGERSFGPIQPREKRYVVVSNVSTTDTFTFVVQVIPGGSAR